MKNTTKETSSEDNQEKVEIKRKLSAQQMAELFETASIGILPSSTVRLEAVSRGLKVICGYFVENQQIGFERSLSWKDILPIYSYNELTEDKLKQALLDIEHFTFTIPDYVHIPDSYIKLMNSLYD